MSDDKKGGAKSEAGQLFLDFGATGLGKLMKGLNSLSASFLLTKNAAQQAINPLVGLSKKTSQTIVNYDKLTAVSGVLQSRWRDLDKFAQLNNTSFEMLSGQVLSLQQRLVDLRVNGKGTLNMLSNLGVDVQNLDLKNPLAALKQIMAQVRTLSPETAAWALNALGLNQELLYTFQQTNTKLDDRLKLSDKEMQSLRDQNDGWNTLKVNAGSALEKFIADQSWLNQAFIVFGNLLTEAILKIGDLKDRFDDFVQSEGFKTFVEDLPVIMKATKTVGKVIAAPYKWIYHNIGEPLATVNLLVRDLLSPNPVKGMPLRGTKVEQYVKYRELMNQKMQEDIERKQNYLDAKEKAKQEAKVKKKADREKAIKNLLTSHYTSYNMDNPLNIQPIDNMPASSDPVLPAVPLVPASNNSNINVEINQNITSPNPEDAGKKSASNIQDSMNEILERQNMAGL